MEHVTMYQLISAGYSVQIEKATKRWDKERREKEEECKMHINQCMMEIYLLGSQVGGYMV